MVQFRIGLWWFWVWRNAFPPQRRRPSKRVTMALHTWAPTTTRQRRHDANDETTTNEHDAHDERDRGHDQTTRPRRTSTTSTTRSGHERPRAATTTTRPRRTNTTRTTSTSTTTNDKSLRECSTICLLEISRNILLTGLIAQLVRAYGQ